MAGRSKGRRARSRFFRLGSRYSPLARDRVSITARAICRNAVFSTLPAAGGYVRSTWSIASWKVNARGVGKAGQVGEAPVASVVSIMFRVKSIARAPFGLYWTLVDNWDNGQEILFRYTWQL